MPLTRPRAISNGVSLSDKLGRAVATLVPEDRAVDPALSAVINELSPNKDRIAIPRPQHNVLARTDKLTPPPTITITITTVMPLV
jgi:hypothetical protein